MVHYKKRIVDYGQFEKRGISMINRCELCKKEEEDIDCIFLHCDYSRTIWDMLCKEIKI